MSIVSKSPTRLTARFGVRSSGLALSPEEFDAIPLAATIRFHRYELINGILIVTPPPGNAEIDPNQEIGYLLRLHQEFHAQGSIIDKVLIEQTIYSTPNRRRADHAIWIGLGRIPDVEKDVPAIVIEFVSAKKRDFLRDYITKRDEYLAIGVREYWIFDRFQRIMTVHRNLPDGTDFRVFGESESYQTDLLPGFVLPIARILARADDWTSRKRLPKRNPSEGGTR